MLRSVLEKDGKYSKHVREDVPGSDIRKYGERGRTSSKGTFVRAVDYEHGGGLATLLTGGWMRVAKDRIDPDAWSYQFGFARKSERQHWRHHFIITERSGKQSPFELKRETLHGTGSVAIKALLRSGVHVIRRKTAAKALAQFLGFKPKKEIVRMPRVGWAHVGAHWIFVRPDEVLMPVGMQALPMNYQLDTTATRHGLHIAGGHISGMGGRHRHAAHWEFERRAIICHLLRRAVAGFCERAGGRLSSVRTFDDRQDDGLGRWPVDLWLGARDRR